MPKGGPDGGDGGHGGDVVIVCDPSLRDLSSFRRGSHFAAGRGGHGQGANKHGATPSSLEVRVAPGTVIVDPELRRPLGPDRGWPAGAGGARRKRRARQQALCHRHSSGAALRREGPPRPGALARAEAAAARRRRPRRAAQRGQVIAARPHDARPTQGCRLPVHHARARAGHARGPGSPARSGGHSGPHRRSERRSGPGPRVPRARRALPPAGARSRPGAAGRLGPSGQPRHRRGRAARARARPRRAAPHPVPLQDRSRAGGRRPRGGFRLE